MDPHLEHNKTHQKGVCSGESGEGDEELPPPELRRNTDMSPEG